MVRDPDGRVNPQAVRSMSRLHARTAEALESLIEVEQPWEVVAAWYFNGFVGSRPKSRKPVSERFSGVAGAGFEPATSGL